MESKLFKKTIGKRLVTFGLICTLILPALYAPVSTPKAQALFGVSDFGFDLEDVVKFALDAVAIPMAQKMVDDMVKSTIDWANTGFEGGPAYVTDPKQFYANSADRVAGEFIEGHDLGFLCSPFQRNIQISLQYAYGGPSDTSQSNQFQCTLSSVTGNIEEFFDGNFNRGGGWQTWFAVTQNPVNNPYGAYLTAKIEVDNLISEQRRIDREQLAMNQGFKSLTECAAINPSQEVLDTIDKVGAEVILSMPDSDLNEVGLKAKEVLRKKQPYDMSKQPGACVKEGAIKTAGATIKTQLDNVLPSGLDRLINVQHMEQLVGAFANGLLQRYVFGDKGLFASDSENSGNREEYDVDDDGIPDGLDFDAQGQPGYQQLDICHHGLKPKPENVLSKDWKPSNDNCVLSKNVTNSPYFLPMCEKIAIANTDIQNYLQFVRRNKFKVDHANTWLHRTTALSGSLSDLESTLNRYQVLEIDEIAFKVGIRSKWINNIVESLAKNEDLGDGGLLGLGLWGETSDSENRSETIDKLESLSRYLTDLSSAAGRCDDPNIDAMADVTPPPDFDPDEGFKDDTTGSNDTGAWLGQYMFQNKLTGSCTIKNGVPELTTNPPLGILPGLDQTPIVTYLRTNQDRIIANVVFLLDGKASSWGVPCTTGLEEEAPE